MRWNESYLNKVLHFHSGLKDFCDACTQGQYPPQCLWRAPPASRRAFTIIGKARVFKGADRAFLSVATRLGGSKTRMARLCALHCSDPLRVGNRGPE
jgi:hypothetical protein